VIPFEMSAERTARCVKSAIVQRLCAGDSADAVSSKEFFGHEEKPVYLKCDPDRLGPRIVWKTSRKLST